MKGDLEAIRKRYSIPAKRGARITYTGNGIQHGTIVGANGGYLRIRIDGEKCVKQFHPTWCITYDEAHPKGGDHA